MEARELRIGNWVIEAGAFTQIENGWILAEVFEPIPLTTEILEKCGFEKPNEYLNLRITHPILGLSTIEYNSKDNFVYLDFEGTQTGKEIKYLHQLQNLYFALTGEELNINL